MGKTDKNPVSEIEMLAATITEGSKKTLSTVLSEAFREYLKEEVLNEDDDEQEENTEDSENVSDTPDFSGNSDEADDAEETPEEADDTDSSVDAVKVDTDEVESDGDEWAEFNDYKVSGEDEDEEYDFTAEKDPETLARVFKLMKNDDKVSVVQNGNMITVKDNEAETEYVIDLGGDDLSDDNNEFNGEMTMAESLGYTDNYQSKDPIEGLSMDASAPKGTRDWHKGVPTGNKKPWAGKGKSEPFGKKAEKVFEITLNDEVTDVNEMPMDEATNVGGFVQQNTTTKSHVPNSNGRKARNMSKGGAKVSGTADPRYSGVNEELQKKVDTALAENKKLKETVAKVSKIMKEAVQVNVNLGHIVRLMVENTTTKAEKENIVKRFSNVKSNDEATALYESITNELKKANTTVINESIKPTEQPKSINESKIYASDEANDVLDMMRRMKML
jgi:hypothetical protein